MANQEHVDILRQGVEVWNEWRELNPYETPNLSSANLKGAFLHEANLSTVDLTEADLSEANLNSADLSDAQLNLANIRGASLFYTNLYGANLNKANLRWARLHKANLSHASLYDVDLSKAHLDGVNLTEATIGLTTFANNDLSSVIGLETIHHRAPSYISIDTLYKSQGKIPEVFLRGAGLPEAFLSYLPALRNAAQPIQFYSCFISYSVKDEEFTRRLYADLQNVGIRCWFAPESLKTGDKLRTSVDEAIRLYDKLLLVVSEHAIGSEWVNHEVKNALESERERNELILFPARIDDAVLNAGTDWAAEILRTRQIIDFKDWKDNTKYQKAFLRLIRDLKTSLARELDIEEQGNES